MEYKWELSEVSGWFCPKENIEVPGKESLRLKQHPKQDAKAQKLPNVLVETGYKFKNEKITLIPQFLPPQAYRYKDIYSSRQDQRIQRCIEQERKQREFHSRPMPNFRQVHERQAMRTVTHRITMPVTPNVLRNSLEMELKRRQREQQLLRQREEEAKLQRQQSLRAKPIPSSSRQPLKPVNRQSVKVEPFNLTAEQRVQQRRVYNIQNSHMQEMKRRELEEQRQREEREANHRQRQLTTFRARPNPFAGTAR